MRGLFLGNNKFDVTALPAIVPTMTKIKWLDFHNLGYTGVCYLTCRGGCVLFSQILHQLESIVVVYIVVVALHFVLPYIQM